MEYEIKMLRGQILDLEARVCLLESRTNNKFEMLRAPKRKLSERNEIAVRMRRDGATYKVIGERLGCSAQGARSLAITGAKWYSYYKGEIPHDNDECNGHDSI